MEKVHEKGLLTHIFRMKKSGSVCVLKDKTNSTRVIQIEDYRRWVSNHLLKASDLALRPKVFSLFEDVNELFEKVKMELSVQEGNFLDNHWRRERYRLQNY